MGGRTRYLALAALCVAGAFYVLRLNPGKLTGLDQVLLVVLGVLAGMNLGLWWKSRRADKS